MIRDPRVKNANPKLSWEAVVDQFEDLIKFAARQQVENSPKDNMISVEDLYQEGIIKLYDCWVKFCVQGNKDMDEFGPIFRTSLFRAMRRKKGIQRNHIDLEDAVNFLKDSSTPEDTVEEMYRQHEIDHLKEILDSVVAKSLLLEIINPSPKTLFEVWADIKRKEMIKSQGKRVNIPKDNRVRMKHIIRSLSITTKQYDLAICEIREKAKSLLDIR